MIKETILQIRIHCSWFVQAPSQIGRIIHSFCHYLWYGFSLYDLMDTDMYVLRRFVDILDKFIENENIGYPMLIKEEGNKIKCVEDWLNELSHVSNCAHKLLDQSWELSWEEEMKYKQMVSEFLHKYLFYLWF